MFAVAVWRYHCICCATTCICVQNKNSTFKWTHQNRSFSHIFPSETKKKNGGTEIRYFLLLPYLQCRFKMHIYRTAPGFKTALICIMFMFVHFYIWMLCGSGTNNNQTINYYILSVNPSLTAVTIMSKFNHFGYKIWLKNIWNSIPRSQKTMHLHYTGQNNAPTLHRPKQCTYIIRAKTMHLHYTGQNNAPTLHGTKQCTYITWAKTVHLHYMGQNNAPTLYGPTG